MGGYITPLNKNLERNHVYFKNRFGLEIAGDLYTAKKLDKSRKHPALIIGPPYGGVKEQGPCVYANELAQRGFVVLTFDQSFMGNSKGEPRHVSGVEIFSENFSACVDYIGLLKYVDREKIGVIGICGSGGFSICAAQGDTRIKALATCSMYNMCESVRLGLTPEEIQKKKEELSLQRWKDAENGKPQYIPYFPKHPVNKVPADVTGPMAEFYRFYAFKRGFNKHALGNFTTTSELGLLDFKIWNYIEEISPRPLLFIIGSEAFSKIYSENAYKLAKEPKELYVVEGANHIDLYDRTDLIPFNKLEKFFKSAFK